MVSLYVILQVYFEHVWECKKVQKKLIQRWFTCVLVDVYLLVFWESENSVSVVSASSVSEGTQLVAGKTCKIRIRKKTYTGPIAETGTVVLQVQLVYSVIAMDTGINESSVLQGRRQQNLFGMAY